ncbi:hypothetical protein SAICODRAFT_146164 [Saitoella complicata NRRL Y-17804]|uniref:uncharacterized protein n=1 Tax=Saitoella complicata (strain BCRC 22490 / CBS 7301 / JCM 7358 / NBRC 10748 / NRRL Y-17804) TaxID=698492 RepID=UPI000868243F|nr:uncharacterized protein SAICODRAFT_146164 [Saitoella complicata NRRL Y-17804]ODQ51525.1 hypothetical protein SAICODRAFT_146164 [Saitoella complicata NRRL Y-17804]
MSSPVLKRPFAETSSVGNTSANKKAKFGEGHVDEVVSLTQRLESRVVAVLRVLEDRAFKYLREDKAECKNSVWNTEKRIGHPWNTAIVREAGKNLVKVDDLVEEVFGEQFTSEDKETCEKMDLDRDEALEEEQKARRVAKLRRKAAYIEKKQMMYEVKQARQTVATKSREDIREEEFEHDERLATAEHHANLVFRLADYLRTVNTVQPELVKRIDALGRRVKLWKDEMIRNPTLKSPPPYVLDLSELDRAVDENIAAMLKDIDGLVMVAPRTISDQTAMFRKWPDKRGNGKWREIPDVADPASAKKRKNKTISASAGIPLWQLDMQHNRGRLVKHHALLGLSLSNILSARYPAGYCGKFTQLREAIEGWARELHTDPNVQVPAWILSLNDICRMTDDVLVPATKLMEAAHGEERAFVRSWTEWGSEGKWIEVAEKAMEDEMEAKKAVKQAATERAMAKALAKVEELQAARRAGQGKV